MSKIQLKRVLYAITAFFVIFFTPISSTHAEVEDFIDKFAANKYYAL